jgi:LmbE family N-acetylglucosaminyl deacetylase
MKIKDTLENSVLAVPENLPLLAAETVRKWGKTLVGAPHPDDESLGCGGAIALLRKFGCEVKVLVMTDGTLSHPNSKKYPASALRDLREREMLAALKVLGVAAEKTTFLRYTDRSLPNENSENFSNAVGICVKHLKKNVPQTILLPWRRDPQPDHFAANQIIRTAKSRLSFPVKLFEYPIWLWELASGEDAPRTGEARAWRLDTKSVAAQKQAAIAAHESQITDLIDDDPQGFRLTPEILANFAAPWEIYLEALCE